jgi:hypothetical protein
MTAAAAPTTTPSSTPAVQSPPFLHWPVSRREFYLAIWASMLPCVLWGLAIYGVRALTMLVAALAAATLMHTALKRWTHWQRGQSLLYAHTLASVLVLVALAHPTWPAWVVALTALLLPAALALVGGPGRERLHIAVAAVLLIQYVAVPLLKGRTYTDRPDALLAQDRLVMGDIRDQHAAPPGWPERWPVSREIEGNDAFRVKPPAVAAADALNALSTILILHPGSDAATPAVRNDLREVLNQVYVFDLVPLDRMLGGVAPNRIGAATLIGIATAGLFLAYRHILRARSVALFLGVFSLTTFAGLFTPATVHAAGLDAVWHTLARFPVELFVLANYLILNSDAPFAAVFLLALPGTEPLTPGGRRVYLTLAAILTASLHRLDPAAPAATMILCLFTPLCPHFDRLFAARSWVAGR